MATHSEPSQRHTKDELMHPGHDHHLSSNNPPCPDPSVHRDTKLQEQASTAALYVTNKHRAPPKENVLDANNKLSSRSAAQSLKYARPEDLPSYPVVGIDTTRSANSAANLANDNHKDFEHWKPDASSAAGKAAMLAKDYKMAPLWKPELSAAGSKAALLAHRDGGKLNLWQPQASAEGNSAANIALSQKSTSPQLDYGYTEDGHKKALMAATGAVTRSKSQKATPPPVVHPAYPDSHNSGANALNAATATFSNKPSVRSVQDSNAIDSDAMRAARIQNSHMDPEKFTSHPPTEASIVEKNNQAALRASSISMAKQMYASIEQRKKDDELNAAYAATGQSAALASHARAPASSTTPDLKTQAMQYIHLQEAAQKLANERLAKMDPDGAARYKAHYGYEDAPRNRMSLRGRTRRRADSEATTTKALDDDSSDDEFTARRIRNQQSGLASSVAEIDAKKRANDRAALLAAAEKKVQAQMHSMDERVFAETGQVSPAMLEMWEAKARAKAAADSEVRQKNFGKVNIGGGKYMDQAELDAIAQARLQPTLAEINDTAEKRRAADEERRLNEEEQRRAFATEKERLRENKADMKKLREQEKAEAKAKKAEQKAAEKARKAEEKEEKRRSKLPKTDAVITTSAPVETHKTAATEDAAHDAETHEAASGAEVIPMTRVETGASIATAHEGSSTMRPELDRHASTILTSSSEASSIAELSGSDIEEDAAGERASEHADRVASSAAANATTAEGILVHDDPAAKEIADRATAPAATTVGEKDTPAMTTGAAAATASKKQPTAASQTTFVSEKRKSRGFGGFFGKFKRNSGSAVASPSSSGKAVAAKTEAADLDGTTTARPAANTTTLAAFAAKDDEEDSEDGSESSFRRHQGGVASISSMSSSDVEDRRGRSGAPSTPEKQTTGRQTTAQTTTTAEKKEVGGALVVPERFSGAGAGAVTDDEDEGEFEEARDHFEDALTPGAAGAGAGVVGRKSVEHETRFHEEL